MFTLPQQETLLMQQHELPLQRLRIGKYAALAVAILGLAYALVTATGLYALPSPNHMIGNPYFSIMEVLTIAIAILMLVTMAAVHVHATPARKLNSLVSLIMLTIATGITSSVHFIILTAGNQGLPEQLNDYPSLFSFQWPSVAYALDILAWDLFFAMAVLFAAPIFSSGRQERTVQILLIISGVLSLAGLLGIPLKNMQVRNIGIIGYAIAAPLAFWFISRILGRGPKA
jgi:hypothetical protein